MFNRRFFIGWIMGAVVMYSAFYLWHGVLSTDFYRINYPMSLFLIFAAIAYIVISFILYKVYELKFWDKISSKPIPKALMSGAFLGFILFCISTVLGVSFSQGLSTKILLFDLTWQLIEQSIGAVIIALAHILIYVPSPEELEA